MSGKTAFVTGSATGIGLAIARKLDREGWSVFAGVHRTEPTELVRGASDRLRVLRVDVSDDEQVRRAAEAVAAAVGRQGLALLINNAAMMGAQGPVESVDIGEFKQLMEVNFWGPLRVTQAFLPLLRAYGRARIVMVTSSSIYLTIPLNCSYPCAKHALTALTEHLRMEMAPFGIEVAALEPGGVRTPMTSAPMEDEERLWRTIPASLRPLYQAVFPYPGKLLNDSFEFEPPERFAERVYRRIILAERLDPRYTIGKGVSLLPVMHRVLPRRGVEWLMRRLFKVRDVPRLLQ